MALGDGRVGTAERPFTLKVGDTVVYSKFGMGITEVDIQGTTYALMREDDVIGIMPSSSATAADVPKIKPLGDRVLLKVCLVMLVDRWLAGVCRCVHVQRHCCAVLHRGCVRGCVVCCVHINHMWYGDKTSTHN